MDDNITMAFVEPGPQQVLDRLSPLVMGGAGFSYQLHPKPESLPIGTIIKKALDSGLRVIDTSPYYEPSEQLLGAGLSQPNITNQYSRSDYVLMTKVGRTHRENFDYSPSWIRASVTRSLERFNTSYLDVVFCHDVEFVSLEEAVVAVGTLFEIAKTGVIKCVGISGYSIKTLATVALLARARYCRPVDVIQNWAQLSLQNTRLEQEGLEAFRSAGVKAVCNSSPLAIGLLRNGGVPLGALGDWHPAPQGLRDRAKQAAAWVDKQGDTLASLALRFAIWRARENSSLGFTVTTITGITSITDLEQNLQTARSIFKVADDKVLFDTDLISSDGYHENQVIDPEAMRHDLPLYEGVRAILGSWLDYDISRPSPECATASGLEEQDVGSKSPRGTKLRGRL